MNWVGKTWENLDTTLRKFIIKFYFFYLGSLYLILLSLSTFVAIKRIPNIDWFFQLELLVPSIIGSSIFAIGLLSLCFGAFKLMALSKSVAQNRILVLGSCCVALPLSMFGFAILFIVLMVSLFR